MCATEVFRITPKLAMIFFQINFLRYNRNTTEFVRQERATRLILAYGHNVELNIAQACRMGQFHYTALSQ